MKLLLASAILLAATTLVSAQSHGYIFFGPGGVDSSSVAHMGGGGEGAIGRGIGLGGELGYVTPWRNWRAGIGTASLNGWYHLAERRNIDPYVSGGYTLFFRSGTVNAVNFGAGLNWWFAPQFGLKLEFRDHVDPNRGNSVHVYAVRAGLTFR